MEANIHYTLDKLTSQKLFSELETKITATLKNAEKLTTIDVYIDKQESNFICDVIKSDSWSTANIVSSVVKKMIEEKVVKEKTKEIVIDAEEVIKRYEEEVAKQKARDERVKQAKQFYEKVMELLEQKNCKYVDDYRYDYNNDTLSLLHYDGGWNTVTKVKLSETTIEEVAEKIYEDYVSARMKELEKTKEEFEKLKAIVQKLVDVEKIQEELEEQEEKEEQELTTKDKQFLLNILDC